MAYPNFQNDFTLETDASGSGLGAILSQAQEDGRLHSVAYASRALSPQEKRYAITELEMLAVVWAMSHFCHYLCGHDVTVITDHSAVKAFLSNPGGSGKHARWWTKVCGAGIKIVNIVYRTGKEDTNADTLSRQPYLPSPACGTVEDDIQVLSVTSCKDGIDIDIYGIFQEGMTPLKLICRSLWLAPVKELMS